MSVEKITPEISKNLNPVNTPDSLNLNHKIIIDDPEFVEKLIEAAEEMNYGPITCELIYSGNTIRFQITKPSEESLAKTLDGRVVGFIEASRRWVQMVADADYYNHYLALQDLTPIEQLFYVALVAYSTKPDAPKWGWCFQFPVGRFTPDFLIEYKNKRVAVELDGHDFHEKTKEQAKRDKQRDRELQIMGWAVFRFTGSEVWKNPIECIESVRAFLDPAVGKSESVKIGLVDE